MKEQLAAQMVKNAYNPEWFKSCIDEAGGIEMIVDIGAISLSNSDAQQYLLIGKPPCAFGARTPMYWVYENRDGKIRLLADIGAADDVKATSQHTKGYRDLVVIGIIGAGAEVCSGTYKFDGKLYREIKNGFHCKPR